MFSVPSEILSDPEIQAGWEHLTDVILDSHIAEIAEEAWAGYQNTGEKGIVIYQLALGELKIVYVNQKTLMETLLYDKEWFECVFYHYDPDSQIIIGVMIPVFDQDEDGKIKLLPIETLATETQDARFRVEILELKRKLSEVFGENQELKVSKRSQPEKALELELYNWLRINGIEAERQVSTNQNHRLDIWIPGKALLELKGKSISSDDFTQALDYYSTYRRSIVLVGTGLSKGASRGLEAAQKLLGEDAIIFMSWGAIRPYLKGLLRL